MPNTTSAKKALRQSDTKKAHNLYWKRRIKSISKNITKQIKDKNASIDIIKKEESLLYKIVDKAAKNNVIHKNKAKRVKSSISKQVAAHEQSKSEPTKSNKSPKSAKTAKRTTSSAKSGSESKK